MLLARPAPALTRAVRLAFAVTVVACTDDAPVAPRSPARPQPLVVTAVTVTNTNDAGPGSLRQAIADATDGATIQFDAPLAGTAIVLSTGRLVINKSLTIEGPSLGGITISGGLASGVIQVDPAGSAILRNLSIVDGRDGFGAGIIAAGSLVLDHTLIANNEAIGGKPRGGGIDFGGSSLSIVNSTISGNVAGEGGGLYVVAGDVTIRSSTITGNSGVQGGGMRSFVSVRMWNSIIAWNIDADPSDAYPVANCDGVFGQTPVYLGKNVSNDESCGTDPALLIADPLLGPLASNGGPTRTHALRLGSAAIDAAPQCTELTDQRYVDRPQGTSCDLGAYEFTYARLTLNAGANGMVDRKTGVATVSGTVTCPEPGTFTLGVDLSQPQRITGRFETIVQATASTVVFCNGTMSWNATLTPQTGGFQLGSATATVRTTTYPFAYLPASVTAPVKLFLVR